MTVRNEVNFAQIPEWILYSNLSAQGIRLYCVLNRHANREGTAHPSRKRLAEKMQASVDTVDRALKELVSFGAVEVRHRVAEDGSKELTSNLYTVRQVPPDLRQGGRTTAATGTSTFAATGGRTYAAGNESQSEPEPSERLNPPLPPPFEAFWILYPKRKGKGAAKAEWDKAVRKAPVESILAGVKRYASDPNLPEPKFIPLPATWLHQGRWDDDPELPRSNGHKPDRMVEQARRLGLVEEQKGLPA